MGAETSNPRIEVVCPKCDHHQLEPGMVVSTLCRGCGYNIQIKDGQAVLPVIQVAKFATDHKPAIQHPIIGGDIPNISHIIRKVEAKPQGFFRKMFVSKPILRSVDCIQCEQQFSVVSDAQSSQCSSCGAYISLQNFEIDREWRREIQTRGNVTILKDGIVIGIKIVCHDVLVIGKLSASIECSGKVCIRSNGRIVGDIKCRELRIEKGVTVEFQGFVTADSMSIDGKVRAQLNCNGTITLEKKAQLQGPIRAKALIVKTGAKHQGALEVINVTQIQGDIV